MQRPSIGRIVLYTFQASDLPGGKEHLAGESRPAIVVRVWPGEYSHSDGTAEDGYNLQVFTDDRNDGLPPTIWRTSVRLTEEPKPGTCHWPPRVS